MHGAKWKQVREVLEAALEKPPELRGEFLERTCSDADVRREVESLLEHAGEDPKFLDEPLSPPDARLERRLEGQTLSHYEVVEELGRGGMGVVYRARDTTLRREVALKVLPEAFVGEPERLLRFEREARVLATLNHPNVATIYGLDVSDGVHFLVLELVSGEDLAARLSRGPIPLSEALPLFVQVARGLESAHEKGIVHRDLKPGNVKTTPEGTVKVLDFGLAKPFASEGSGPDLSQSPTVTREGTAAGVILGTASYMSPEQARGQRVDKRTDVWAFGCVLYEALTGRLAFRGETISDTIASILQKEPEWEALPSSTPSSIRSLLRRCLRVDRDRRLHDIADARVELEEAIASPAAIEEPTPRRSFWPWLVAAASVVLAAGLAATSRETDAPELRHLSITAPEGTVFPYERPALSPDGRTVAFVAQEPSVGRRLWARPLDSSAARALPGTEGAAWPFWSPDGRRLGFFAGGKLKTIELAGGSVRELADVELARGGTWSADGTIVFAPNRSSALFRVSDTGGPTTQVTTLGPRDFSHRFPQFLPDGARFLYNCTCAELSGWHVGSLDPDDPDRFLGINGGAVFAPPDFLIFVAEGWLMAQRFDPVRLELEGEPVPLRESPDPFWGEGIFSASAAGVLVYARDELFDPARRLGLYDRSGRLLRSLGDTGAYASPELSPDDTRVAFHWADPAGDDRPDIWVRDLTEDTPVRVTMHERPDHSPVWSPDGRELLFSSGREPAGFYKTGFRNGQVPELVLAATAGNTIATEWNDRFVVYFQLSERQNRDHDIWALPLEGGRDPFPVIRTLTSDILGQISPDGRWIAYVSRRAPPRAEVYVQRFPEDTDPVRVSAAGGNQPRWRGDGRELFYITLDGALMAVDIELAERPLVGLPKKLFQTRVSTDLFTQMRNFYDVTSDGEHFVVVDSDEPSARRELHVILNWQTGLER